MELVVSASGSVYKLFIASLSILTSTCIVSSGAFSQVKEREVTIVINGRSGQVNAVVVNDKEFIDVHTLARTAQGSVTFQGNRIILTVPAAEVASPPEPVAPEQADSNRLSREFVKAAIEEIALMREWASPLAYAIQNGYPITEQAETQYKAQAASGLKLAEAAIKTDADRSAFQLLTNEFAALEQWSNKLIDARKSMDTAKYAMSENALRDDPMSQKIIACGHFLGSMLGSGAFQDDPSCH